MYKIILIILLFFTQISNYCGPRKYLAYEGRRIFNKALSHKKTTKAQRCPRPRLIIGYREQRRFYPLELPYSNPTERSDQDMNTVELAMHTIITSERNTENLKIEIKPVPLVPQPPRNRYGSPVTKTYIVVINQDLKKAMLNSPELKKAAEKDPKIITRIRHAAYNHGRLAPLSPIR